MKPEIKTKWVAALRSGEYKQGTRQLSWGDGSFCCLGVLTDLAVKEGVGEWGEHGTDKDGEFDPCDATLPPEVGEWAGVDGDPAVVGTQINRPIQLWRLNDHHNRSFTELADLIEEQL